MRTTRARRALLCGRYRNSGVSFILHFAEHAARRANGMRKHCTRIRKHRYYRAFVIAVPRARIRHTWFFMPFVSALDTLLIINYNEGAFETARNLNSELWNCGNKSNNNN